MTTPDDAQHAAGLGGMLAAIEYCRIHRGRLAGTSPPAAATAALYAIEADCKRGGLDLTGSLATVALRAVTLACQASSAAGRPMTPGGFLDGLEGELTPPGDLGGLLPG